jgi:hypothetical protein
MRVCVDSIPKRAKRGEKILSSRHDVFNYFNYFNYIIRGPKGSSLFIIENFLAHHGDDDELRILF